MNRLNERLVNRTICAGSRLAEEMQKPDNQRTIDYWRGYRDALSMVMGDVDELGK